MYHSPSPIRLVITRVLIYALMTITVFALVTVSILYIMGYRFDNKDHRIEQSGLVQYISKPSGATITVDGATLSQKTPANSTVSPGSHTFTFKRDGYQQWQKTVTVRAGTLTWLNYARLIPEQLPVQVAAKLPSVADALASPNDRFMAIIPKTNQPNIRIYDLANDTIQETTLTAAADQYSDANTAGVKHRFQLVEWDNDGRYLLVKHTYGTSFEWLVFDRRDGKLISNVTKTMDVAITSAHIVDRDGPTLIALIDDDVRSISVSKETVSRPLVSNISEFHVYDNDTVSYVTTPEKKTHKREAGVVAKDGTPVVVYTTQSAPSIPVHVTAGHYFDKDYIVVSDGGKITVFAGSDFPRQQSDASSLKSATVFTFPKNVSWLQMSPEGRFVIAQNGATFQTYDIERQEVSSVLKLGSEKTPQELQWLDNYYLWSDAGNVLNIEEFDGANRHKINTATSGLDATISPDGNYLYSIAKTKDGYQLQRVKLILN